MTHYSLLVSLHVSSVIIWLGSGTTLVFLTIYARRPRNRVLLGQLGALIQWMGLLVLAPAAFAAFCFGVAAAHAGHWPDLFWFHVGEGVFAFSFLSAVAFRLPLLRRARRGSLDPARLAHYLLAVALAELTAQFIAVADMVIKPSGVDTSAFRYGVGVAACGFFVAAVTAYRAHRARPAAEVVGPAEWPRGSEPKSGSRAA
jgi:hypothetical protein